MHTLKLFAVFYCCMIHVPSKSPVSNSIHFCTHHTLLLTSYTGWYTAVYSATYVGTQTHVPYYQWYSVCMWYIYMYIHVPSYICGHILYIIYR
jgi:hypothetical protein